MFKPPETKKNERRKCRKNGPYLKTCEGHIDSFAIIFERVNMFSQGWNKEGKRNRYFLVLPPDGAFTEI